MGTASFALSSEINNHELEKLVAKVTDILKLSAVQGMNAQANPSTYRLRPSTVQVGGAQQRSYPTVAKAVSDRLAQVDPARKRIIGLDLGRDTGITRQIRQNAVDMRSSKAVIEQVDLKRQFAFVNDTNFSEQQMDQMVRDLGSGLADRPDVTAATAAQSQLNAFHERFRGIIPAGRIEGLIAEVGAADTGGGQVVVNRGLKFRIHEVKCVDETNPEWPGSDEIAWGGAVVDDKGNTTKVPEFFVGGGFDDGDKKTYTPAKVLHSFSMDESGFPKTFLVALALAEKDSGGMSKFIEELFQAIKAEVTIIMTALGAAAGAAIGAAIGGSIGTAVGGPLGIIIGVVAGAILGALVGWLVGALKDDIFPPEAASVFFYSASDTFAGGSLVSPKMHLNYRDFGGHYRVTYDWQINR